MKKSIAIGILLASIHFSSFSPSRRILHSPNPHYIDLNILFIGNLYWDNEV
jgi:hypothetical protein